MTARMIRIGGGSGMWGDDLDAPRRLAEGGPLDYLMLDYLAEVTMSVLQRQKARDSAQGYARDVVGAIESVLPWLTGGSLKVLANAGGVNPQACGEAILAMLNAAGARDAVPVALVRGDDLLPRIDKLLELGHELRHMDSGEPLASVRDRLVSANAYLGSTPLTQALRLGARVVISGRCHDAALAVAPMRHEFDWSGSDHDLLAAGTVAGHIIECGAQASGGNCSAVWQGLSLASVGYPIVEMSADGTFVVTKHPATGGRVSRETVIEQLVYEIGDPRAYITADVISDFTSINLVDEGNERVRIGGVRGRPPSGKLKVSAAYRDGYKAVSSLVYAWPDAAAKARAADKIVRARLERLGLKFEAIHTEVIGAGATHGALAGPDAGRDAPEVMLRIGVRDSNRASVERFTREIAPLVLNGPPGVTGYFGARAKVEEILAFWPALIDGSAVTPVVEVLT
jgi:hypothetical protein